MRLIDADKLIEKLRDFKEWENDDGRPIHTMSEIQRIDRCINFAQTEPTAYDVDKVVEELQSDAERWEDSGKEYKDKCEIAVGKGLRKAIEIVKQGGVSDVVCEWRKSKDYPFDWLVGCDGCEVNHRQGDYCPRCGKKIKVVE